MGNSEAAAACASAGNAQWESSPAYLGCGASADPGGAWDQSVSITQGAMETWSDEQLTCGASVASVGFEHDTVWVEEYTDSSAVSWAGAGDGGASAVAASSSSAEVLQTFACTPAPNPAVDAYTSALAVPASPSVDSAAAFSGLIGPGEQVLPAPLDVGAAPVFVSVDGGFAGGSQYSHDDIVTSAGDFFDTQGGSTWDVLSGAAFT